MRLHTHSQQNNNNKKNIYFQPHYHHHHHQSRLIFIVCIERRQSQLERKKKPLRVVLPPPPFCFFVSRTRKRNSFQTSQSFSFFSNPPLVFILSSFCFLQTRESFPIGLNSNRTHTNQSLSLIPVSIAKELNT